MSSTEAARRLFLCKGAPEHQLLTFCAETVVPVFRRVGILQALAVIAFLLHNHGSGNGYQVRSVSVAHGLE